MLSEILVLMLLKTLYYVWMEKSNKLLVSRNEPYNTISDDEDGSDDIDDDDEEWDD